MAMKKNKIIFIFNNGYKNKFFVPFQLFQPFFQLAEAILNILLLPTSYQSNIYGWYLRETIRRQMNKRKIELERDHPNSKPTEEKNVQECDATEAK